MRKVLVMGLDSAPPQLVFHQFKHDLPNLRQMMERGLHGELRSCNPPITIPAWMVMATGKSPGELGLYGFRHRKGHSYTDGWIASSLSIKDKTVWDLLGETGRESCVVSVPPAYPPKPVNGCLISCFITPDPSKPYTYPASLKDELIHSVGEYIFDVEFRTDNRDEMLAELYRMTERRFQTIEYLYKKHEWPFFMFVEIGIDRVQHAFWKYFDRQHPKYEPGNKYETTIRDYYRSVDAKLGRLLSVIDKETVVLVVSDHGAKGMKGAFCVNQWLEKEGYLRLKDKPGSVVNIEKAAVDWERTKAWGWGGYYARIFLNVKGREAAGIIDPQDYERERELLSAKLKAIRDPQGRVMNTRVHKPEDLYEEYHGDSPDLMVYFDDLYWRSAGTLGHSTSYLSENDTGPDDAVHDYDGIFILHDPKQNLGGRKINVDILDVAPTILKVLELPVPTDLRGKAIEI